MGGTVAPLVGNDLTQLGCLFFDRTKQVGHKTTHIIAAVIAKPASSFRSTGRFHGARKKPVSEPWQLPPAAPSLS
jgi:hypothetical protein